MAKAAKRDLTLEEFDLWSKENKALREENETGDELGGRVLSLLPTLNGAAYASEPDDLNNPVPFEPEASRYRAGWSAYRQRVFILALAETGSVHRAAKESRMSARGAYALRVRSPAFREAWDNAQQLAVGRLSALAFDRAINGRPEQMFQDGIMVGEKRVPNDRLLMWLLARLDPKRFAMPWEQRGDVGDPQADASAAFEGKIDAIEDVEPFNFIPAP